MTAQASAHPAEPSSRPAGDRRSPDERGARILVLAKTPVPGRVKTRLCPPFTPVQAARLAEAALIDTLDAVSASRVVAERVLVIDGSYPAPPRWRRLEQRGGTLGERLANAFADAGGPALLIGMDTPQVTAADLDAALELLAGSAAVLGLAPDGGWWALGLPDVRAAEVLRDIPTSRADTGARTREALLRSGIPVADLPLRSDVDTASDARAVAVDCPPRSRFRRVLADIEILGPAAVEAPRPVAAGAPGHVVATRAGR